MHRPILFLLASVLGAIPQDGAEAAKAIQALIALEDGDEEGFDTQADTLTRIGADALELLEAAMKNLKAEKTFRLRRVRDMIWYPLNIKGAFTVNPGTTEGAKKANWPVGGVALSFNGQAVTGHLEYGRLLREAEKAGVKVATVEVFHKGRRWTVQIEGLRMGGTIANYPHVLAQYVHQGHRSPAWDEAVQTVLAPWNEKPTTAEMEQMVAAVRAGCRDSLVLFKAFVGLSNRRAPEEAAKLWKEAREKLLTKPYAGLWATECRFMAGYSLFVTGDLDEALRLNEEARKGFDQSGSPAGVAASDIQRAVFLEEKDSAKSVELVRSALDAYDKLQIHVCWRHNYLAHLLRVREQWTDVGAMAERYGIDKARNPAPLNDAHDMMARFRNRTMSIVPMMRLYPTEEAAKNGRAGGLTGSYYRAPNFGGNPVVRIDPEISFRWGESEPHPDVPADDFSVRWTGQIEPEFTDTYTFTVRVDDGVRLWIDGKPVIDAWADGPPRYLSGTAALTAGRKTDIKLEFYDHGFGAQVELYWDCPSFAAAVKSPAWTLVSRYNFEVAAVRHAHEERSRDESIKESVLDAPGVLRINGERSRGSGASWASYRSVRIEADVKISPSSEDYRYSKAGLRACLDPATGTEVGFGVAWPDAIDAYFYQDRLGPGFWAPRIDLRKSHRLALEIHQGRAAYFVDGKLIDQQFFPSNWSGWWGLKASDGTADFDNVEVFVPAEKPADLATLRGLYDSASAAFLKKNAAGALAFLEEAAALQPRVEELGRLCAAYLSAGRDGRPMLDKRLAAAVHPQAVRMLLEAELHLGPSDLDLRTLRGQVEGGLAPDGDALSAVKEASETGPLALYALGVQRRFERGVAPVTLADVESAYRYAMSKDPAALVHKYRLAAFLRQEKQEEKAAALLQEMKVRAPKIELPDAKKF